MRRDLDLETTLVGKYVMMAPLLNERTRRLWAAAESIAIGFGGDAIVSSATGLARQTIRNGRRELAQGIPAASPIRRPGAGRPGIEATQPGVTEALDLLVEPLTRGDPMSPLRWTCKSAAKLAAALTAHGWPVSATTVGRLLDGLGYRLHALQKAREGAAHPDRNAQFEHINATATAFICRGQPVISVDTNYDPARIMDTLRACYLRGPRKNYGGGPRVSPARRGDRPVHIITAPEGTPTVGPSAGSASP